MADAHGLGVVREALLILLPEVGAEGNITCYIDERGNY
jgi:hypothetical protein